MRLAMAVVLLIPTLAAAQDGARVSVFDEKPGELPPLIKIPPANQPPVAGPAGPSGEYDPGYFYLPERNPDGPKRSACGPDGRIWIGAGLELAWMRAPEVAPLLRVGNANGTLLYGGQRVSTPMQAGFSLAAGVWMNDLRTIGWDASFLYVNGAGSNSLIGPVGDAVLVLPSAGGAAMTLADPSHIGAFQAGLDTLFATADVNSRTNLLCSPDARLDALVGYRFARLSDDYEVYGKRLGSDGEIVRFRDEAHTRNDFHGGQIGLAGEWRAGRWFATGSGKVAFGVVFADSDLEGKYRLNTVVVPNGFYARPGAAGSRSQSEFAVMPTAGFSFGRQIGEHARISVGYQFLYLSRAVRGPEMVESSVEPSGFWVQSASLAAEWRF
jgi:hypothetical protein